MTFLKVASTSYTPFSTRLLSIVLTIPISFTILLRLKVFPKISFATFFGTLGSTKTVTIPSDVGSVSIKFTFSSFLKFSQTYTCIEFFDKTTFSESLACA